MTIIDNFKHEVTKIIFKHILTFLSGDFAIALIKLLYYKNDSNRLLKHFKLPAITVHLTLNMAFLIIIVIVVELISISCIIIYIL